MNVLELSSGDVAATLVPERGAIVATLKVGGKDVLYLDRATLEDPTKNVRGGIPVLFPFAGKLPDEAFLPANTKMKQHGFGRNKAWAVKEKRPDLVRVALVQDQETRAQYPYDFECEHEVRLLPRGLEVAFLVHATGNKALPVSPGWHPYFNCKAADKARVTGDVPIAKDALRDDKEFDFGIEAPARGRARFEVPGLGALAISFAPAMRHLQFWSQPGKDFICIEPFFGPANTVNTDRRLEVPAGRAAHLWMRIELA